MKQILTMIQERIAATQDFAIALADIAFFTQEMIDAGTLDAGEVLDTITTSAAKLGFEKEGVRKGFHDSIKSVRQARYNTADPPAALQPKKATKQKRRTFTGLPRIETHNRSLDELADAAWAALRKANSPIRFLQRSGLALRIERDDDGFVARELTPDKMRHELGRAALWERRGDLIIPPKEIAIDMLASASFPLPTLNRIVPVPVFAPDGTLERTPGYCAKSSNYYAPPNADKLRTVAERPTDADVLRAVELIFDEVLIDFPFKAQADRATAVALMIQPFVRDMIAGPTPCYVLDSSMNGSGKSMLGEVLLYPSQLKWPSLISEIGSPEEMEKLLSSSLLARDPICFIDNVNNKIASGVFANYITATTKKCRRLGKSEIIELPVKQTFVMTGTNLQFTNENARRAVQSRLEPTTATPETRSGFRHEFLKEWVEENAYELIWAAHVIVQNWIAQGRPKPPGKALGSFERWHQIIGGILHTAGIGGFLGNQEEFHATANEERSAWTELVAEWYSNYAENRVTANDLLPIAEGCEGLELYGNTDRARQIQLGKLLRKHRSRIYASYQIKLAGAAKGCSLYKLEKVSEF